MSHWTRMKVSIRNPDTVLLERALSILAEKLGAKLEKNAIARGYRASEPVHYLLRMRLPYGNGYGVKINPDGTLTVVVDEHGAPMTSREFSEELVKTYTSLAIAAAAQELGMTVSEVSEGEDAVRLTIIT